MCTLGRFLAKKKAVNDDDWTLVTKLFSKNTRTFNTNIEL